MNPPPLPLILLLPCLVLPTSVLGQSGDPIRSSLRTVDVVSGRIAGVHSADRHVEAPNWSRDGQFVVYGLP